MNINPKVFAQAITTALTMVVAYLVTKYGIHFTALEAATVSGAIAVFAGFLAGYIKKVIPQVTPAPAPVPVPVPVPSAPVQEVSE